MLSAAQMGALSSVLLQCLLQDSHSHGWLVKGSGAQVMFSSILPVARNDEGRNRKSQQKSQLAPSLVGLAEFWVFLIMGQFT